ncbi:MAG: efflux RND transporter permease subunit, partial [Pseudomonadota bacterium]
MWLIDKATNRPVTVVMFFVAVAMFGLVSLGRLKVNLLPDLSYPTLTVRTELKGAAPYASTCFEGFKAYRWDDGKARVYRLHDHIARMQKSAASLRLPVPDADQLAQMVIDLVAQLVDEIPAPPASLYLRPTLIGTDANIGAAAGPSTSALLYVIASPVGDYFSGGATTLKLLIDDEHARTT